jgi:hypothetical protein
MPLTYNFPKVIESNNDPGLNDDIDTGFIPGTLWINTDTTQTFFCITNTANNALWLKTSKAGSLTSSSNLYERLVWNAPYMKSYFTVFSEEEASLWSGTAVSYNRSGAFYSVSSGSILTTPNMIDTGSNTRSFYLYVEHRDSTYTTSYSIDGGNNWISFNPNERTTVTETSDLRIKISFTSNNTPVYSFGIVYDEQPGCIFIEDGLPKTVDQSLKIQTATLGQVQFDISVFTYDPMSLSVYFNGLLKPPVMYNEVDNNTFSMLVAAGGGEQVISEINRDEENNIIPYVDTYFTATAGQTLFSLPWNYMPGKGEIEVYVNGNFKHKPYYTELYTNQFQFATGLNLGDAVYVRLYRRNGLNVRKHYHIISPDAGQTVVPIPFSYILGNRHLKVFRNGIKQYDEYFETDETTITFASPLLETDMLCFFIIEYFE